MKLKESIYLETTIPSYATAKPSADIIVAARQLLTNLFWEKERRKYNLFVSQFVIDECSKGDKVAAQKRIQFISGIEQLEIPQGVEKLASVYQKILCIPEKARYDCLHLAYCVLGKIDYLLSWNCTHLGNVTQNKIRSYNDSHSLWMPSLVTPEFFTT